MLCPRTRFDPRHHATGAMTEFCCAALSFDVPGIENVLAKPVCVVTAHDLNPDSWWPAFANLNRNLVSARRGVAIAGRHLHGHRSPTLAHTDPERPGVKTLHDGISASAGDMAQPLICRI